LLFADVKAETELPSTRKLPSRQRVRTAFDRIARIRGGVNGVTLDELRLEFVDGGGRLVRYLEECRNDAKKRAATDVEAQVQTEVDARVARIMAMRDGPKPRRPGRPSDEEKRKRLTAPKRAGQAAGDGNSGGFKARAAARRDRLRLAGHPNARPDDPDEELVAVQRPVIGQPKSRTPRSRMQRPLDARERLEAALSGRLHRPRVLKPVAEADWVGANNKAIAQECCRYLRSVGGRLEDEVVRAHLMRHYGWMKKLTERALAIALDGSRLRKHGGWWRFLGETKEDAEHADRRFLETLYLEAATEAIEEAGGWTTIADVEDALGTRDRFPDGWLGDALYRAANQTHPKVMRSGDGRYRAAPAGGGRLR
jgi:hypothetical protein